jgi:serine protease Do
MTLRRTSAAVVAALATAASAAALPPAPPPSLPVPPSVFDRPAPQSVEDLKLIQQQTRAVVARVLPATVGVQIGMAWGSGVIVSRDGMVLTAGHVSGEPGRNVTLILHDGKRVKGKTLGLNRTADSGMIQITDKGDWPYVEIGKSGELKKGQWCLATGHPGGWFAGRTPVVRLGRVTRIEKSWVVSDCTLVGGDSGGPLFDMRGRLIGIHSQIRGAITSNVHVPVDSYRDTWDRLAKGESWGGGVGGQNPAYLGVQGDPDSDECRLGKVVENGPAAKAGLLVGDVITSFDGKSIKTYAEMLQLLYKKKPNDVVALEVRRGKDVLPLKLTVGRRPRE